MFRKGKILVNLSLKAVYCVKCLLRFVNVALLYIRQGHFLQGKRHEFFIILIFLREGLQSLEAFIVIPEFIVTGRDIIERKGRILLIISLLEQIERFLVKFYLICGLRITVVNFVPFVLKR